MSMRKCLAGIVALLVGGVSLSQESPNLGVPVDDTTLSAIDFTVLPNGDGLPAGNGSAAEGVEVYLVHCIACHGEAGVGSVNDALVGGIGSLASEQPKKTVGSYWPYATTVFDYVRRAMPLHAPGTLSDDQIYAVTAYILFLNGIIDESEEMNADTLPAVKMPNANGFRWDFSP